MILGCEKIRRSAKYLATDKANPSLIRGKTYAEADSGRGTSRAHELIAGVDR
jgi:hypothetical protein